MEAEKLENVIFRFCPGSCPSYASKFSLLFFFFLFSSHLIRNWGSFLLCSN